MAGATVRDLVRIVDRLGLTIARLPHLAELKTALGDGAARLPTRPVAVEDLPGRSPAVLDRNAIRALVSDRRVLVPGCRQRGVSGQRGPERGDIGGRAYTKQTTKNKK